MGNDVWKILPSICTYVSIHNKLTFMFSPQTPQFDSDCDSEIEYERYQKEKKRRRKKLELVTMRVFNDTDSDSSEGYDITLICQTFFSHNYMWRWGGMENSADPPPIFLFFANPFHNFLFNPPPLNIFYWGGDSLRPCFILVTDPSPHIFIFGFHSTPPLRISNGI